MCSLPKASQGSGLTDHSLFPMILAKMVYKPAFQGPSVQSVNARPRLENISHQFRVAGSQHQDVAARVQPRVQFEEFECRGREEEEEEYDILSRLGQMHRIGTGTCSILLDVISISFSLPLYNPNTYILYIYIYITLLTPVTK